VPVKAKPPARPVDIYFRIINVSMSNIYLEVSKMIFKSPPEFFEKSMWLLFTLLLVLIIYYLINIGNNFVPEKKRIKISNTKLLSILGVLLLIYLLKYLFKKYTILSDTFFTITLSAILAYILNPLVLYLESKGIKRVFSVITIYFIIIGILFIIAFLVIPSSSKEVRKLLNFLPVYFNNIKDFIENIYNKFNSSVEDLPPILQGVEAAISSNMTRIQNAIVTGIRDFIEGLINSISKIVSSILTPILTFYFLVDKEFFKKKIIGTIPEKYKAEVLYLANEIDTSVSSFVRGRLIMAIFVGVVTTIFLLIVDVDFAMVIGFITALADIIPYIGPFLGFLPAFIFAFIISPIKALWVSIFFILIQWVENNIIGPKILGDSTGMHPIIILLTIIIGGGIFGVLGMILSVPFLSITKIFFIYFRDKLIHHTQKEL
jgi:predicted PurR-regulated permease PerM